MNRYEQDFYEDISSIAKSMKEIVKLLENIKPKEENLLSKE